MKRKRKPKQAQDYSGGKFWYYGNPTRLDRREGRAVTGYKKACIFNKYGRLIGYALVTLRINANTSRMQPRNYKCRAANALVVRIVRLKRSNTPISRRSSGIVDQAKHYSLPTERNVTAAASFWDLKLRYRVGEIVRPREPYCRDAVECESGIHFFLAKSEALRWDN